MHSTHVGGSGTRRGQRVAVRDELASRAARSGQSLQEYLAARLAELASRPDLQSALAAVRSRARASGRLLAADDIVADRDSDRR